MAQTNLLGESMPAPAEKQKSDKPKYQYRFTEGQAEWAVRDDGHHVVLRYGNIAPGCRVYLTTMFPREYGKVTALLPGSGPSPRPVEAVVQWDRDMVLKATVDKPACRVQRIGRYPAELLRLCK